MKENPKNSAGMPKKENNLNNSEKLQKVYFLSLELENVRCFTERQKIDFSDGNKKPRQWTIILGDNGTGKTTILQAISAILPENLLSFLSSVKGDYFTNLRNKIDALKVSASESKGYFSLLEKNLLSAKTGADMGIQMLAVMTTFNEFSSTLKEIPIFEDIYQIGFCANLFVGDKLQNSPKGKSYKFDGRFDSKKLLKLLSALKRSLLLGYGASRQIGYAELSSELLKNRFSNISDSQFLINPEEWLLQADYASKRITELKQKRERELELIKEILLKILPDIDDIRFSETESGRTPKPIVEFHTPYGWVESKDLSLGYRTSMAWIVDFASRMFDLYPESENPLAEPAVVLIDEIDLHLHPKWQRELIDYLTNLFPNTQFIVTTHSPLIVQAAAARDANIVVCRREGDHVVIDQSVEAVRGWRADQILTSDLFDLPSTRDTRIEKLEKQRREILSKARLTKADEKKLKEISAELEALPVNEETEDDKAMDIIRRAAEYFQTEKG